MGKLTEKLRLNRLVNKLVDLFTNVNSQTKL